MQAEALQIRARCGEMVEKIKALYGMDLSQVRISFDLRGRAAGKAGGRGYSLPGSAYFVKFNRDMLTREAFEHVITNTVPHEYAHVVCFMNPALGKNHNEGWARVCRSLGGSANRTHQEEVVYGKGVTYEYTTDRGHKVRLSERFHKKVQAGTPLRYRKGLGTVTITCAYSIVGVRGRTLETPIVRQAPNHPAQIETFIAQQRLAPPTPTPAMAPLVLRGFGTAPATANDGQSKAAKSRSIMLSGYRGGQSYENIINAMIFANGYDRALARGTFKANAAKVGIPTSFYA